MNKLTAELKDWGIFPSEDSNGNTKFYLSGVIYNDEAKRFKDATEVRTTSLVLINFKDNIAETKNTLYFLSPKQ